MKRAVTDTVLAVVIASARIAHGHHAGDITNEPSLWRFLAVGTLVLLAFFGATVIKKLLGQRRKTAERLRERDRAQ